jgi:hypothetical protein
MCCLQQACQAVVEHVQERRRLLVNQKPFLRGGRLNDTRASRWSAVGYSGRTTALVLDAGGLLMEVADNTGVVGGCYTIRLRVP